MRIACALKEIAVTTQHKASVPRRRKITLPITLFLMTMTFTLDIHLWNAGASTRNAVFGLHLSVSSDNAKLR